jgi:hypothetical protein
MGAGALCALAACSYLPASQERAHAMMMLQSVEGVTQVTIGCEGGVFAGDGLCADVVFEDGAALRFERVGYDSFGPTAVNVIVSQAGGLVPRVASCSGIMSPNFHRGGALGHHFAPTLIDVKEAASRRREVMEEVQYWPQCPQHWEVQDNRGQNFRYCARRSNATEEPPKPDRCS